MGRRKNKDQPVVLSSSSGAPAQGKQVRVDNVAPPAAADEKSDGQLPSTTEGVGVAELKSKDQLLNNVVELYELCQKDQRIFITLLHAVKEEQPAEEIAKTINGLILNEYKEGKNSLLKKINRLYTLLSPLHKTAKGEFFDSLITRGSGAEELNPEVVRYVQEVRQNWEREKEDKVKTNFRKKQEKSDDVSTEEIEQCLDKDKPLRAQFVRELVGKINTAVTGTLEERPISRRRSSFDDNLTASTSAPLTDALELTYKSHMEMRCYLSWLQLTNVSLGDLEERTIFAGPTIVQHGEGAGIDDEEFKGYQAAHSAILSNLLAKPNPSETGKPILHGRTQRYSMGATSGLPGIVNSIDRKMEDYARPKYLLILNAVARKELTDKEGMKILWLLMKKKLNQIKGNDENTDIFKICHAYLEVINKFNEELSIPRDLPLDLMIHTVPKWRKDLIKEKRLSITDDIQIEIKNQVELALIRGLERGGSVDIIGTLASQCEERTNPLKDEQKKLSILSMYDEILENVVDEKTAEIKSKIEGEYKEDALLEQTFEYARLRTYQRTYPAIFNRDFSSDVGAIPELASDPVLDNKLDQNDNLKKFTILYEMQIILKGRDPLFSLLIDRLLYLIKFETKEIEFNERDNLVGLLSNLKVFLKNPNENIDAIRDAVRNIDQIIMNPATEEYVNDVREATKIEAIGTDPGKPGIYLVNQWDRVKEKIFYGKDNAPSLKDINDIIRCLSSILRFTKNSEEYKPDKVCNAITKIRSIFSKEIANKIPDKERRLEFDAGIENLEDPQVRGNYRLERSLARSLSGWIRETYAQSYDEMDLLLNKDNQVEITRERVLEENQDLRTSAVQNSSVELEQRFIEFIQKVLTSKGVEYFCGPVLRSLKKAIDNNDKHALREIISNFMQAVRKENPELNIGDYNQLQEKLDELVNAYQNERSVPAGSDEHKSESKPAEKSDSALIRHSALGGGRSAEQKAEVKQIQDTIRIHILEGNKNQDQTEVNDCIVRIHACSEVSEIKTVLNQIADENRIIINLDKIEETFPQLKNGDIRFGNS